MLRDADMVLAESSAVCRLARPRRARVEPWMDGQATEQNNAWSHAFLARAQHSPAHADAAAIDASVHQGNPHMKVQDAALQRTGAFVCAGLFTLTDGVLGVATQHWQATPTKTARAARRWPAATLSRANAPFLRRGCTGLP